MDYALHFLEVIAKKLSKILKQGLLKKISEIIETVGKILEKNFWEIERKFKKISGKLRDMLRQCWKIFSKISS